MGDVWDPSLCATLYQTVPAEQMKQIAQQQTRLRSRKEENKLIFCNNLFVMFHSSSFLGL